MLVLSDAGPRAALQKIRRIILLSVWLESRMSTAKGSVAQLMRKGPRRGETAILVISPTRELAAQIAVEAKALSTFHGLTTQVRCENLSTCG